MSEPVGSCVPPRLQRGQRHNDFTQPVVGVVGSQTTAATLLGPERIGGASSPVSTGRR